jgi:carboxypeptidase Taq
MEQDLVAGSLQTRDIPEAWDAKMQNYLGLSTIDSPGDGPMQDVHWPAGLFGYFPSYSLGAMMAAQQWATIAKDMPDIDADLAAGRFERVNDWRRNNIWSQGSRWSTPELIGRATGSPLDATHFKRHLEQRYG